jgi:ribosomal protein L37AE/L43A
MELTIHANYRCPSCGIDELEGRYNINTGWVYSCDVCDLDFKCENLREKNSEKQNNLYCVISHKELKELEKIIKIFEDMKHIDRDYIHMQISTDLNCPNCDYYILIGDYDIYNGWVYSCEDCGHAFKYNTLCKKMVEIDHNLYNRSKFHWSDGSRIFPKGKF